MLKISSPEKALQIHLGDNEIVKDRNKKKYKRKGGMMGDRLALMAGAPNL